MNNKRSNPKSGYTLVEMIIYIAILAAVYFLIVNTLLSFNTSYKNIVVLRHIDTSAVNSIERMTRDVRAASIIDTANSAFGVNQGVLVITSTSGIYSTTTKFYLDNGVVKMDINGAYYGPLTLSSANVSSLVFRLLDSGRSTAIKIDMVVNSSSASVSKSKTYHSTVLMKGI